MTDFEQKSLNLALQRLLNDGVVKNEEQKDKLFEVYNKDPRAYRIIHDEINKLRFDRKLLESVLKKDEKIAGHDANSIDVNKKVEYALSLENITDFEKDGKSYIKIHYPYPYDNVRIIENRSDPYKTGKERFESLQGTQKIMSVDGITNATSIFEQSLARDCHEVIMRDIKEVSKANEYAKLSFDEKEKVYGTIKALITSLEGPDDYKSDLLKKPVEEILLILNRKVYISPEENIVVLIEENNPSKDEVKTLKSEKKTNVNGVTSVKYTLKPLNEIGYRYDGEYYDEELEENISQNEFYQKDDADDIEKEKGSALTPKAPWQKKRKKEAAFISILWFVIFAGVIAAIILVSVVSMILK